MAVSGGGDDVGGLSPSLTTSCLRSTSTGDTSAIFRLFASEITRHGSFSGHEDAILCASGLSMASVMLSFTLDVLCTST